jgi:hypothetical protein
MHSFQMLSDTALFHFRLRDQKTPQCHCRMLKQDGLICLKLAEGTSGASYEATAAMEINCTAG